MDTLKRQENSASEIAKNGIRMIMSGKVRNHKLGNSSRVHTGAVEKKEYQEFRDFLPGKNGCMVYELTGSDCYE